MYTQNQHQRIAESESILGISGRYITHAIPEHRVVDHRTSFAGPLNETCSCQNADTVQSAQENSLFTGLNPTENYMSPFM